MILMYVYFIAGNGNQFSTVGVGISFFPPSSLAFFSFNIFRSVDMCVWFVYFDYFRAYDVRRLYIKYMPHIHMLIHYTQSHRSYLSLSIDSPIIFVIVVFIICQHRVPPILYSSISNLPNNFLRLFPIFSLFFASRHLSILSCRLLTKFSIYDFHRAFPFVMVTRNSCLGFFPHFFCRVPFTLALSRVQDNATRHCKWAMK